MAKENRTPVYRGGRPPLGSFLSHPKREFEGLQFVSDQELYVLVLNNSLKHKYHTIQYTTSCSLVEVNRTENVAPEGKSPTPTVVG